MKVPNEWDTAYYWKLKDEVRKVVDRNPEMAHNELMKTIMLEAKGQVNPKMIDSIRGSWRNGIRTWLRPMRSKDYESSSLSDPTKQQSV